MLEKELETNTGFNEEGLRLLARIIARVYIRDVWDKTVIKDVKQSQTEGREKERKKEKSNVKEKRSISKPQEL